MFGKSGFIGTVAAITAVSIITLSFQTESGKHQDEGKMEISKTAFGKTPDGEQVDLYTLTNTSGLRARIMTYGAIVVSLETPDRDGYLADITLGYENLQGYIENNPYFGAIVGRYGNRIAKGRFALDGVSYQLATNNGENHLHGGLKGFDKVVWRAEPIEEKDAVGLRLIYVSRDGEEGYPGTLTCEVVYLLTSADEFKVSYKATTDKATVLNLTHHSYFNLSGCARDILGHELTLNAGRYTPVDEGLIPTGELAPVAGTPFDFNSPKPIGLDINQAPGGYDHNFVLNKESDEMTLAARVCEPQSGRVMEIYTTEPGLQFYSGNFLDSSITGKAGKVYHKHYGFCLETQHFPDSPNRPNFPSVVLRPGETYRHETVHKFYAK
jgi:aldose 1-epimerase